MLLNPFHESARKKNFDSLGAGVLCLFYHGKKIESSLILSMRNNEGSRYFALLYRLPVRDGAEDAGRCPNASMQVLHWLRRRSKGCRSPLLITRKVAEAARQVLRGFAGNLPTAGVEGSVAS